MLRLQIAQYEYDNAEVIACAKAIKELGYDLYGDFRKLFLDEGINDPSNKEVIFKVNYAEDLRSSYMTQLWYNWFSFNTTLEMVNSFFTANGLPVKPLEADNGASIPADPTYDKDYPFENRDPRLKLSVLCPGDEYRCDGTSRYQVHWQPANWDNKTGFAAKKGANETLGNLNNDGGDKILMRYGEVLLAWAEAENEENGPKGAYEMIDRLRRRVGMVTLTESLPNLTKETMRALIRNERRVELFHEGQRWHDIRRWKIAEKVMTDAHGLDVSKLQYYPSSGATSPYWQYEEIVIDKRSFNKDRDYLVADSAQRAERQSADPRRPESRLLTPNATDNETFHRISDSRGRRSGRAAEPVVRTADRLRRCDVGAPRLPGRRLDPEDRLLQTRRQAGLHLGGTSGSHLQDRLRRGHALRERLRLRHGAKGFARADQFGDARHAAHRLARLLRRQALLLARRADARPRGAHVVALFQRHPRWSRASPTPATARSTEPASSSSTTVR